jgi:hypothetical protein
MSYRAPLGQVSPAVPACPAGQYRPADLTIGGQQLQACLPIPACPVGQQFYPPNGRWLGGCAPPCPVSGAQAPCPPGSSYVVTDDRCGYGSCRLTAAGLPHPATVPVSRYTAPPATGLDKIWQDYPRLREIAFVGALGGFVGAHSKSRIGGAATGAAVAVGGYFALYYGVRGLGIGVRR